LIMMKVIKILLGKFQNFENVMKYLCLVLVVAFSLSGCMVGPKYKRPATQTYAGYSELNPAIKNDTASLVAWTEVYKDPELTKLIQTVLNNNLDLLTAIARVEEARSLYGITRADLYPSLGYDVGIRANNFKENSAAAGIGINHEGYRTLATMNWEIDLFGKLRHQKASSWAQFLATQNNAQAVRVSLIAETATFYFMLRDQDNRLDIAKKTVASRSESLKIISERFAKGYVSELDQLQAQQQLALAMAIIPNAERQIVVTQNALRVLSGQAPGNIARGFSIYDQQLPPEIPAGIPSELLQRRPDIIAAEQTLISQTEQIGVATAMRFPSISLTGLLGLASPQLTTLFNPASFAIGVGGGLAGPIFEFGKNKKRVAVQMKRTDQFNYQYQKIVLNAFAEVDNSLASLRTYKQEHEAYLTALTSASKAFTLTQARYDNGYTGYLELLIQQNNLFDAQLNESATQTQQNIAVVNLFKSLGGGWNVQ